MQVNDILLLLGFDQDQAEEVSIKINNFLTFLEEILAKVVELLELKLFPYPYSSLNLKPY